jgi:SAM-dependent methyltransferase
MSGRSGEFHEFERAGWERAASEYDRRFSELTLQSMEPLLDVVGTSPGLRLLDVACGPGHIAAAAARRGCVVVGIDFSPAMVAAALQAHPDLDFREGDAAKLDFPDDSFDAVVMNFGMLHLEFPERAATEAFRVLCSGGRYAFTVWDVPESAVGFSIILHSIQSCGNIDAPLPAGPPFFRFSDPEEGRRLLSEAGFLNVQSIQVPQVWKLPSGDDLFITFETAAVRTAALLHAQTPSALKKIRQEVAVRMESFRRGDSFEIPMPAILTHGLRPRS